MNVVVDTCAVTVLTLGCVFLYRHPEKIANWGLYSHLQRRNALTRILREMYCSIIRVYFLLHGKLPETPVDRLMQFKWVPGAFGATVINNVAEVVHIIEEKQQTAVEWDSYTEPLFLEIREKVLLSDSADWHALGFQGKNPATDFRGAGRLGFDNFYDFCITKTGSCQKLLTESRSSTSEVDGQPWYPLALVSIRLSMALGELLKREKLLIVQMLASNGKIEWEELLRNVHHGILLGFHDAWLAAVAIGKVKNYFDNEIVLGEFEATLLGLVYKLICRAQGSHLH